MVRMNTDSNINMVVFEIRTASGLEKVMCEGPCRADDCLQQLWNALKRQRGIAGNDVTRIYSEWEPSNEDKVFVSQACPNAPLTYSFSRPARDGWERAIREAKATIESALAKKAAPKKWWQFWK